MPDLKFYCGTSGFAYKHWKPHFYPQSLAAADLLAYYATRLNAVELPYPARFDSSAKLHQWIETVPENFRFLPKIRTSLRKAEELAAGLAPQLQPLREAGRLGPILFQISSHCKADPLQLQQLLQKLPENFSLAFEFRHPSWLDESVYKVLRNANSALCLTESEDLEAAWVLTSDFVYMRLRKPEYLESKLISMQYRVEQYLANAYPTYAIFKGGQQGAGALNAEKLFVSQREIRTAD